MADDLFRARLTGINLDDPADAALPINERAGFVEFIKEDSGTGTGPGATEQKGVARVVLPNGLRCPTFAARHHFFGNLLYTPPTVGTLLVLGKQPPVLVRRDVTASTTTETSCGSIVASVVLPAVLVGRASTSGTLVTPIEPVTPATYGMVAVEDHLGNRTIELLAYFPAWSEVGELAVGSPVQLVNRVLRTGVPGRTGEAEVWVMNPLTTARYRFAVYAPATTGEAIALGYPVI